MAPTIIIINFPSNVNYYFIPVFNILSILITITNLRFFIKFERFIIIKIVITCSRKILMEIITKMN